MLTVLPAEPHEGTDLLLDIECEEPAALCAGNRVTFARAHRAYTRQDCLRHGITHRIRFCRPCLIRHAETEMGADGLDALKATVPVG